MNGGDALIEELIAEVRALRIRVHRLETQGTSEEETQGHNEEAPFEIGDRVRITNRVRKPATWTGPVVRARSGTQP